MNRWMNRRWVVGLAALLWLLALPGRAADASPPRPLASTSWLRAQLGRPDLVVVDASPAPMHRQRHIPGAVPSTLFTFGPADVPVAEVERHLQAWGVGPGHRIVLYDQGGAYMAARLFWDLVHHGLPADRLMILDGGLSKWIADGGAVTAEPTAKPAPGSIRLGGLEADVRVRLPEFLAALADPSANVALDALSPSYYYGGAAFFHRAGHTPHARLMPSEDFYNADKTFKPAAELQRMLDHLGIRREQQVLAYCGGGGAAAVPFFALRYLLGYPRVKLFQESQMGWLADRRELPVWTYGDPHLLRESPWLKAWSNPMLKAFGHSKLSIVDVRPAEAFRLGHVPAAVNLPAAEIERHRPQPEALAASLVQAGVDPSHEALVVSDGGLNAASAMAFLMLEHLGQPQVSIFLDSLERWAELGHEVARPAPAGASSTAPTAAPAGTASPNTPTQRPVPAAPAAGARTARLVTGPVPPAGTQAVVYLASGPQPLARAPQGRVLHLPAAQFLEAGGRPKPAKDIWNLLAQAGVPRYASLVLVADEPGDAAINYVILRLMGFPDVRVWAPSAR